jgi:phage shock protein A/DNA-binding XRE family transcriptional regulator
VAYQLRMSGEIHDWLADLQRSDPPAAMMVGEALDALMTEDASLRSPLVVPAAESLPPGDLTADLESSYQRRLERLRVMRRRAAEAAALTEGIKDQLDELDSVQAQLEDRRRRALETGQAEEAAEAASLLAAAQGEAEQARQLLPSVTEAQNWLRAWLPGLQARTDAYRARKEVLKAAYTAARADLLVDEALADPDLAGQATDKAAARLREVTAEIERELGRKPIPDGLLELRPGAPGDSGIRIIFAVEPPGTALLIAVLEGGAAVLDRHREAVTLSAEVLLEARAGRAPEAAAHGYDVRSFLGEFYPGRADEVTARAAALVARNRGRTLAEQRTRLGLTQTEVAQRMGVRQERVSAIERAEPGATEVRTLAAYVEALGGRLEIVADIGGERVPLR